MRKLVLFVFLFLLTPMGMATEEPSGFDSDEEGCENPVSPDGLGTCKKKLPPHLPTSEESKDSSKKVTVNQLIEEKAKWCADNVPGFVGVEYWCGTCCAASINASLISQVFPVGSSGACTAGCISFYKNK